MAEYVVPNAAPAAPPKEAKPFKTVDELMEALRVVVDPEIQLNVIDLGLVYELTVSPENDVRVKMSLTSVGCPYGPEIVRNVNSVLKSMENVGDVEVEVVWNPPWSPARMSEEARMIFGY